MKRIAWPLLLLALVGVVAAPASGSPRVVPLTATISSTGSRSPSGFTIDVSGTVTCARAHRFAIVIDAIQVSSGGFAAGSFPGSTPTNVARAKATSQSLCGGQAKPWTAAVDSRGKTPVKFVAGAARVCVIVRARLAAAPANLTDMTATCAQVRLG